MGRQLMGFREYARHREANNLPGSSLRAVQKAIETGRITVVQDDKGKQRIDPEVADIQWGRNTDPDQSARANSARDLLNLPSGGGQASGARNGEGGTGGGESNAYWDARIRRETAEASKAEIQLEEMAGRLVKKDTVERAAFEIARLERDMLLSVPSKIAAEVAAMDDPVEVEQRIRNEIRRALDAVANLAKTRLQEIAS